MGVLRSPAMRAPIALLTALALAPLAPDARAQAPAAADSGLLVIYDQKTPVAHEHYTYQFMGDSLVVTATTERQFMDQNGQRRPLTKVMYLVVDAHDLGLMRYLSNQDFNGHKQVRGLTPTDTVLTYYREYDGLGSADRVVQPPGRLFVLDPQSFTLFDVLCRSLVGKEFETRRVQLLAMAPDTLGTPLAMITLHKPDTLRVGARRVALRHYSLDDHGVRFELWADARGRMVRMANEPTGLSVVRVEQPAPSDRARSRKPVPR